ncbi:MAG: aldo/keto reductase [Spirochaeta sp.]|jgi:myo-inositol catabolism protein IolS|nr:aldo/keto reductase [Spirochaeta sp.]
MIYRTLGKTGLTVSVIGVGTWQFGGEWGVDFSAGEVDAILGTARDEGINLIDTAECYGDHLAEKLVGERLRHERGDWIVASKFGHHFHGHMDRTRHWNPTDVRGQLEASLKALRTDYLDVLQFHSPTDDEFFNEDLWAELERIRRDGLVRYIGLSVSKNDNLLQVDRAPEAGCETLQIVYNRVDRTPEDRVLPAAVTHRLGVLARVPLASGFLTGKYGPDVEFPANDWRARMDSDKRAAILKEVETVRREEVPPDAPMAQWALVWPLRNPAVSAVIPGCKNVEQTRSNARAVRWIPDSEEHPYAIER